MFDLPIDERLTYWSQFRKNLDQSKDPFAAVWNLWQLAPYVHYNHKIDPFYQSSWPTPWEILVENKYDDFTKSLMIGWTLKLTERFKNSNITIHTYVDNAKNSVYNIIDVDNEWLINYNDNGPVPNQKLPESFSLQNLIEVKSPR